MDREEVEAPQEAAVIVEEVEVEVERGLAQKADREWSSYVSRMHNETRPADLM